VAAHKVALVQQLLQIGADPAQPIIHVTHAVDGARTNLLPLHLACLGRVKDEEQLQWLLEAAASLPDDIQASFDQGCDSIWVNIGQTYLMLMTCCMCWLHAEAAGTPAVCVVVVLQIDPDSRSSLPPVLLRLPNAGVVVVVLLLM
jgi:hypothetical protein